VTALEPADLLASARAELARAPGVLAGLVSGLDAEAWRARPAPTEWAPVEIVCHLRDEETEDFGARVRVVAKGRTRFKPIDPERWAVERRYLEDDGPGALAAFRERRTENLAFLATLTAERLTTTVTHARTGGLSGLDLVAAWVAHDRLHIAQLAATLARVWADRWATLRVDYAGPIPHPPPRGEERNRSG
jgi:hypothetical protein